MEGKFPHRSACFDRAALPTAVNFHRKSPGVSGVKPGFCPYFNEV